MSATINMRGAVCAHAARLFCFLIIAPASYAGIVGSKHDFSAAGWDSSQRICIACHTPHSGNNKVSASSPLWNHTLSNATYTLYASPTLLASPEQPRAASKLCLSCHDGTVAVDSFGGANGGTFIQGEALVGTDLRDTHPISIPWVHKGVQDCSGCHVTHWTGSVINILLDPAIPFYEGRVECPSCHEPHNNMPQNPNGSHMLRKPLSGSQICLHCHQK